MLGIRWYFFGLGTGLLASYRISNFGFWVGTQVAAWSLGPNVTIGLRYHIPFK